MSRLADKLALVAAAVAIAAIAWVLLHYSGDGYFPTATIIAFVALLADNRRLRKRVRELGGDPNRRPGTAASSHRQ